MAQFALEIENVRVDLARHSSRLGSLEEAFDCSISAMAEEFRHSQQTFSALLPFEDGESECLQYSSCRPGCSPETSEPSPATINPDDVLQVQEQERPRKAFLAPISPDGRQQHDAVGRALSHECPSANSREHQSRNQRQRALSEPNLNDSDAKNTCSAWLTQRQTLTENEPSHCCRSKQNITVVGGASCTSTVIPFDTTCKPRLPTRPHTVPSSPNLDASVRDLRQQRPRTVMAPVEQHSSVDSSSAAPPPLTDAMRLAGRVQGTFQQQQQQQQKQAAQWMQTALPQARSQDRFVSRSSVGELQSVPETGFLSAPIPCPRTRRLITLPSRSQGQIRYCRPNVAHAKPAPTSLLFCSH